jgi:hypothetical protein
MLVTILNKKTKKEDIRDILSSLNSKGKHLRVSKYSGRLKLKKSPLTIQKKLRNEWG